MPLDPAFVADCPYAPEAVLLDEILEIDHEASRVRARMPTSADLPLTRDQRAHPERHPRHVSGGFMIHMTGIMGFLHAYYILGLRHADGWIGYGTHIHGGRFRKMGQIGVPLELEARALSTRKIRGAMIIRYGYRFSQGADTIYEGEHTAVFTRVGAGAAAAAGEGAAGEGAGAAGDVTAG